MRGLPVLLLALLLLPGTAAQTGEADLLLRYPNQVAFTVWGDGATYNRFLVEAEPGDAVNATVEVRLRGGENSLTEPVPFEVTLSLEGPNGTVPLAATNGTWAPGRTERLTLHLNGTLPDLPAGRYGLAARLETGAYDPDTERNDPGAVPLDLGEQERSTAEEPFSARMLLGPAAFLVLLAAPFVLRRAHRTERWQRWGARAATAWEDVTERWLHTPDETRRRRGLWTAVGVLALAFAAAMVPVGGLGFGAAGVGDALLLGVLAGAVHLGSGWYARVRHDAGVRRERGETGDVDVRLHLRPAALAAAQTLLLVFVVALLWQQLGAATDFFRWPALSSLGSFVAIGISIGAVYALIAIGYTMVYGILRFINFAHGEVFTWGAYFAWMLMVPLGLVGLVGGLLGAMVLTGLLGAAMERVAYRPLRNASRLAPLVTAIALSLLLQAAAQFWFRARKVTYTMDGSAYDGSALQAFFSRDVAVLGTVVDMLAVTTLVVSVLLLVALHLFVRYSKLGRAMRATADDLDTARTIGIRVDRTIAATFVIGSMLAAVGGVFFGLQFGLKPTMGLFVGIKAFTAAVVGGIGNLYGAFLGGFLIGMAENVGGQFIDSRFQKVITFAILVAFLLWRPHGLFGKGEDRR